LSRGECRTWLGRDCIRVHWRCRAIIEGMQAIVIASMDGVIAVAVAREVRYHVLGHSNNSAFHKRVLLLLVVVAVENVAEVKHVESGCI
jgi:hypothetical protein